MSTTTNLRKRTSQINYKDRKRTSRRKIKEQEVEAPMENMPEAIPPKQPIIAPNGKIFYPCQYCSKIFPQKTTSITHMKKCPNKSCNLPVESESINENESNVNNNKDHCPTVEEVGDLSSSGSNTENNPPEKKIMITQNIIVKEPCSQKLVMNDPSVYDYDEEDSDKSLNNELDKESKENEEDILNNKLCKHCNTLFDNSYDLSHHVRYCQKSPKKLLPPDEIQKYFDLPNREFCPICEKPIKTRNYRSVFIKHLLVHTTGLTHDCGICKKKFRRRDHMRAHQSRHIVPVSESV